MYFFILFLLSISWVTFYRPGYANVSAYLSYILQQIILFSFLYMITLSFDSEIISFILSGVSLFYVFFVLFNALIFSITSMSLTRSIKVLSMGGDFLISLEEVGFSQGLLLALFIISGVIFSTGGFLELKLSAYNYIKIDDPDHFIIFIFFVFLFVLEQFLSKNNRNYMSREDFPSYILIFQKNKFTLKAEIPDPLKPVEINDYLSFIKPLQKPENIIYILLESFRRDIVNEKVMPNLLNMSKLSLDFKNAFCDSIYTNLSWNTIILDRPAYTFSNDVKNLKDEPSSGALPLKILKRAGYRNYISISANLKWKGFYERIMGKGDVVDFFYSGIENGKECRSKIDNRSTGKIVSWIKNWDAKNPFFMLLQLDSTHWTYYFDQESEIATPCCSDKVNIAKLSNEKNINMLFNRYQNAARHIDNKIGDIIKALKEKKLFDDTVIVVVSDHGEGFSPGMIGHSVLDDEIKRTPLILKLPSVKPEKIERPIQHKDIFPTLFDYLKIDTIEKRLLYGSSFFKNRQENKPLLCFHGSAEIADLTLPGFTVRLKSSINKYYNGDAYFTPMQIFNKNGEPVSDELYKEYLTGWQTILKNLIEEKNIK